MQSGNETSVLWYYSSSSYWYTMSPQIPQLEGQTPLVIDRTTHVEDERGGTREEERESEGEEDVMVVVEEEEHPPREFVVEQPKLLLADPVEPMPEKQPLPPSLSNTGDQNRPR